MCFDVFENWLQIYFYFHFYIYFHFFKAEVESTKEEMAKHVEEAELNKASLGKELDLV